MCLTHARIYTNRVDDDDDFDTVVKQDVVGSALDVW